MRIPENLCVLLPKALKMRAIKHTIARITDSSGCTKCAPAQMPWHLRYLNPALLNRQGMSTHPTMENGSELRHWKGQLVIGLRAHNTRVQTDFWYRALCSETPHAIMAVWM